MHIASYTFISDQTFYSSDTVITMFTCIKFNLVSVLLVSVLSDVFCRVAFIPDKIYDENDICNDTPYSICLRVDKCPPAVEDIANGGHPKICSFDGNKPIVCCDMGRTAALQQVNVVGEASEDTEETPSPSPDPRSNHFNDTYDDIDLPIIRELFVTSIPDIENTKCVQKCLEYGKMCKAFGPYVAGGIKAVAKELPHMALIGFGPEDDKSWQCGGSIVSKRYILSAAHCTFAGNRIGYAKWVRLGELDYMSTTDTTKHEDYTIIERINHPDYNPPKLYNDIALYKVDRDIIFNDYIKPVCLHTVFNILERQGKAAGWGRTEFVGPTSNHLLYADINFVQPEKCKDSLQNRLSPSQFPDGLKTDSIVCAGEADGSKDTCQGDSGGPLFFLQYYPWPSCLFRQVGITSSGLQCTLENSPGLYTRVSRYIPWIESIVWANDP